MYCPTIQAEIETSTRMKRENTLRQFNYSLPLGMNIMGNWVPLSFIVLMTPVSGYRAIVTPVPDDNDWFYEETHEVCPCFETISVWERWYEEVFRDCDEYVDSYGEVHRPSYNKLHNNPLDIITIDKTREYWSGKRFYKAPQTLIADGGVCNSDCWTSFNANHDIEDDEPTRKEIKPTNLSINQNNNPVQTIGGCSTCARRK